MINKFLKISCLAFLFALPATFISNTAEAQSTKNPDQVLKANTFIKIAQKAMPSVVSINVELLPDQDLLDTHGVDDLDELRDKLMNSPGSGNNFWRNFDPNLFFGEIGSGSGVIIKVDDNWAYAVTNRHVIDSDGRVKYTVVLDSSYDEIPVEIETPNVQVVGTDELTDLAVIKMRVPNKIDVKPLDFADSDQVMVGEFVLALGNPLDLNNSMSQGIVSAKNRNITEDMGESKIERLLQTTAVINPGNSGGPLVNLDGNIVGINNAIATTTGRWAGVGFAIPANQAKRISEMLIETGKVSRGYLGIMMADATEILGVEITDVNPDTPAEGAGLEAGDVIIRVNGVRITDKRSLLTEIGNRLAGEEIDLEYVRPSTSEDPNKKYVVLAQRPSEDTLRAYSRREFRDPIIRNTNDLLDDRYGFEVSSYEEDDIKGVEVTKIKRSSDAYKKGLRKGDIIIQVNGIDTTNLKSLFEGFSNSSSNDQHTILYSRDGDNDFFQMDVN